MSVLARPLCNVDIDGQIVVPDSGTITLDETNTYATASFRIPLVDLSQVDDIDPRTGLRCVIDLNGKYFDLGIRTRIVQHERKSILIEAASDEVLLAEYSPLADITYPDTWTVRQIVNAVLTLVIPGAWLVSGGTDGPVAEAEALTWKAGTNAWKFLQPLTAALGFRLFCDELRLWRLVETSYVAPGVITVLPTIASAGEDVLSRDGESWVDGVIIRYRWTTAAGVAKERIDAAGDPGKVDVLDFDTPYPGPGVAASRLNRLRSQGRTQTATSIVRYGARPGMEARFHLPGTSEHVGRIQRVVFTIGGGFMDLGVRELTELPATACMYLPAGEKWIDSPVGASWTDE